MKLRHFLPAIAWFLLSTVLLWIPGDELPQAKFFDIPYFDKYVHIALFAGVVFFFCLPFNRSSIPAVKVANWFISISLYALAYGIVMEFVQKYFVPNRSFDLVDIAFDAVGAAAGAGLMWSWYKKIGPDRNRGRNQN
jgi:VanZ family protein